LGGISERTAGERQLKAVRIYTSKCVRNCVENIFSEPTVTNTNMGDFDVLLTVHAQYIYLTI